MMAVNGMPEVLYQDKRICVCIKPEGVLSTDEPGGMPELLRAELGGANPCVLSVHRLDRAVSGLMVFARSHKAAAILSEQVRSGDFKKSYLAVVHGTPDAETGEFRDLLMRDKARRMSFVVKEPGKDVQEAILEYSCLERTNGLSLMRVELHTGRTHQIRVQFASRGLPLWGDGKYGLPEDDGAIALWSHRLAFYHPETGEKLDFSAVPPKKEPWTGFVKLK